MTSKGRATNILHLNGGLKTLSLRRCNLITFSLSYFFCPNFNQTQRSNLKEELSHCKFVFGCVTKLLVEIYKFHRIRQRSSLPSCPKNTILTNTHLTLTGSINFTIVTPKFTSNQLMKGMWRFRLIRLQLYRWLLIKHFHLHY